VTRHGQGSVCNEKDLSKDRHFNMVPAAITITIRILSLSVT